jgi:Bacterial HORMA domain 2
MSTFVAVNTYTHSVTYVTDKILLSLKEIIRESGLSPEKLTDEWVTLQRGISRWLATRHLEQLILEVYNPRTDALLHRWDFEIAYELSGDGTMWVDTDDIKYHIRKAGFWPSNCDYCIIAVTKPGRPDAEGWSRGKLRSTDGLVRHAIGTTMNGNGLGTRTAYWRSA